MDSNSGQDSIQVFIRVKPIQQQQNILAYTETQIKLDRHQFAFDKIFPPSATQTDVFHHVGNKLISNVLDGYNSCVFVYGQTGSGKTHTMIGQNNGLMQQAFHELFSRINRMKNAECFVTCSYFELYNQQIMDLLQPKKQKKLQIRQDAKKGVFVQSLAEETAFDCDKIMEVLYTGMKNRHIGQTQMNRQSSRSHSVFTISLSCKMQEDGKKILKTPKLHFVDLAGSERQKMTQATGDRLKQAGNINRSLTTLGMVINALTSQKPRSHIPYRDSKLTCLLRDSLGGNSKTIIIATVSSIALSFQQTLSTLNFANRAKMVKVKAQINEESLSTNIEVFKEQIRRLKAELLRLKSQHHRTPIKIITHEIMSPKHNITNQLEHHFEEINKKITAISDQLVQGVTSPSLQALLSNLNMRKPNIGSSCQNMMISEENGQQVQSNGSIQKYNPAEFIEYLNSNYELLTQINTKVNQYVQIKQELRNSAMNKKLSIQHLRTPSKFQRDQYQELLNKRQDEIRYLEERCQQLQSKFNVVSVQRKDLQRKLEMKRETSTQTRQQIVKIKEAFIQAENYLEQERTETQKLKNQILRNQKLNQQLTIRLKQTKQLHLYAEEKYENQRFSTSKLTSRLDQVEKQVHHHKKISQNFKDQRKDFENQIQNLKLLLQDKQSKQEEMKNQLSQMQETLEFNKRIIEDLTKKTASSNNQILKMKQKTEYANQKQQQASQMNQNLAQKLNNLQMAHHSQLEQKTLQVKQIGLTNDKLNQQIQRLNKQIFQQKQLKQNELSQSRQNFSDIKRILSEKQGQLSKSNNQLHMMQDSMYKIKTQKQTAVQNYSIKIQSKIIENNMLEQKYNEYKREAQILVDQIKKQLQSTTLKNTALNEEKGKIQTENKQITQRLKQAETKVASIQHVLNENQQLKKSYKETIKENYRLKGKYQSNSENQGLQKQKNDELLSKVQFYEEKFNLMSMQYKKIQGIVKRLKEKQLQSNKKIQFYEENMKLRDIQRNDGQEAQQRSKMIGQLKQENRELKYKLDNLQGNLMESKKQQYSTQNSSKKPKYDRESASLNVKYEKFRLKLTNLMKNWQGYSNQATKQHSTEEIIDLCEMMFNENAIKFQTIAKGIRRQQKLKSQNHFILKQNIYLKQKIEQLQKDDKKSSQEKSIESKPRKMVKSQ